MWYDVKMMSYYVIYSSQTSAKTCLEVEQEQQSIQSQYDRWGHHLPSKCILFMRGVAKLSIQHR